MSTGKSPFVLPQSTVSGLRRSARLISRRNRDVQGEICKDVLWGSELPRRSRRILELEASKRLVYSSSGSVQSSSSKKSLGSNCSICGFSSPKLSLRLSSRGFSDASKDNSTPCISTKPVSTSSSRMNSTNVSSSCTLRRSPRFASGEGSANRQASSNGSKSGNSVLSRFSTKLFSSDRGKGGNGVKSRDRSNSHVLPKTKGCDDEEEVIAYERKRMRTAKPDKEKTAMPKADEEERGLKTKNKLDEGWTEELELALQEAYLTVKPSPDFWKKVSKMVPGKSAQECFDRVNSSLITPLQHKPRSRARKTNFSTIPQFSLSASKLLNPNSPMNKIQQRRNNHSKKTIRHLVEKQNHMDQGLGFDLFSVLEPSTKINSLSTPTEKGKTLPKILESPVPFSQASVISPPVLKQVKNKALHEKYIDHLHIREARRKAESTRLARKENIRPTEIQNKNSVKASKDALFSEVEDAIKKLKGLEAENSSGSSESYGHGETDEEDESI